MCATGEEAYRFGEKEARERWPADSGWTHLVAVGMVPDRVVRSLSAQIMIGEYDARDDRPA